MTRTLKTFTSRWAKNYCDTKCAVCNIPFVDGEKVVYTLNGRMDKGKLRHSTCFTDAHGDPIYE